MTTKQQLEKLLPYGIIATRKWLLSQGMSRHSIDNALKSKKIQALATGVFSRTSIPLSWWDIIHSLQSILDQTIHVGGLTAIELQGFGHYLSGSKLKTIHLYSNTKPPEWLSKINCGVAFKWHGTKRLWNDETEDNLKAHNLCIEVPIIISNPERAMLELLMDVPKTISFEHANEIMQGMTSLSPKKLQSLLEECKNIKVKRLFLWLAEQQGYAWFKKIDVDNLELGSGKRVIAKDGKLDNKYLITVPKHLYGK